MYLELAVMTLGEYVMISQVIPACCTSIVKEMVISANRNSALIVWFLQKSMKNISSIKLQKDIEKNNIAIIGSLKSLCEILAEHNKRFTRNSSELNLAVGAAAQSTEELEIHTSILNAVNILLSSSRPSLASTRAILTQSLEASVILSFNLVICLKSSKC